MVKRCARERDCSNSMRACLVSSRLVVCLVVAKGRGIDASEKRTARKFHPRSSGRVGAEFPTDRARMDGDDG